MGAKAKTASVRAKPAKKPSKAKPAKQAAARNGAKRAASKPAAKRAATKPSRKRAAAKPARKRAATPAQPVATMPHAHVPRPVDDAAAELDDAARDGDAVETTKKPGALARFGRGVGSLLAKVTGRGKKKPVDDATVEIVTDDIVASWPAGTKPPPPPGHED